MVLLFLVAFTVGITRKKQESDKKLIQLLKHQNQLERDLTVIRQYEKTRLGRELHDGLCQELAAISCETQILFDDFEQEGNNHKRDLGLIHKSIHNAMLVTGLGLLCANRFTLFRRHFYRLGHLWA